MSTVPRAHALGAAMLIAAANHLQATRTERMANLDPTPGAKAGRVPSTNDIASAVKVSVNVAIRDHALGFFSGEITQVFDEGVDRAAAAGETDACNLFDAGVLALRDEAAFEQKEASDGSNSVAPG